MSSETLLVGSQLRVCQIASFRLCRGYTPGDQTYGGELFVAIPFASKFDKWLAAATASSAGQAGCWPVDRTDVCC